MFSKRRVKSNLQGMILVYSQTSIIRSARDCRKFFEISVVRISEIGSFRICSDFFLINIVEVMGTSAEASKIMSWFKVELIIILRLTGQRTEPGNKKKT